MQKESNVQFGEGGAGTFSDGKLNTLIKDKDGRNAHVLEIFVEHGAKEDITYENKPHIGTDVLVDVVRSMREEIRSLGGTVRFSSCVTDVVLEEDKVKAVIINGEEELPCDVLVLALGHSARDTFAMLEKRRLPMEAKSFAVGLRVEHPQEMINEGQYGECAKELEAAPYKVTFQASNGRGVYSFCMCPGGYVVNASSEEGRIAVNGMSYSKRDGQNANSAIIVSVSKEDFKGEGPLAGVEFQRQLEENAYKIGKGKVPQQLFADYEANQVSKGYGAFESAIKGETSFGNLREIFPDAINQAFLEGMHGFSRYIKNFDRGDAILSGVESRTSSPVRMVRGEDCESALRGIYPCGEGAGYAGGITSAAMDGCKVAEAIARKFQP